MIKKIERIYQKGVSLVEAMTAAAVLGLAVVVFVTLQANQESDFATLLYQQVCLHHHQQCTLLHQPYI